MCTFVCRYLHLRRPEEAIKCTLLLCAALSCTWSPHHRFSARLAIGMPRASLLFPASLPGLGYRYILPHPGFIRVMKTELRSSCLSASSLSTEYFLHPLFKTPQFPLSPLHWIKQDYRFFVNSVSSNEERKRCTQETQSNPTAFVYSSEQLCRTLGPCWRPHCYTTHKEPWGRACHSFTWKWSL